MIFSRSNTTRGLGGESFLFIFSAASESRRKDGLFFQTNRTERFFVYVFVRILMRTKT